MKQDKQSAENKNVNIDMEKVKEERQNKVAMVVVVVILVLCVILGVIGIYGRIMIGDGFSEKVVSILQFEVRADESKINETGHYLKVTGGIEGTDYLYVDETLIIKTCTPIIILGDGEPTGKEQIHVIVEDGIANLTLHSVTIDSSKIDNQYAILSSNGGLSLSYDGENKISAGAYKAGIQMDDYPLTLCALSENASITVTGGYQAAGIGGGEGKNSGLIEIYGGNITAVGGTNGAGIGAGSGGCSDMILISHANVKVSGGNGGAGIGGGCAGNQGNGNALYIEITESDVTAIGGSSAAGIGGGYDGNACEIQISGSTIQATSAAYGAGIGGGNHGYGQNITIKESSVSVIGGEEGAGIGGGYLSDGDTISIIASEISAVGGKYGAGIGGGYLGSGKNISITDQSKVYVWGGEQAAGMGSGNNMKADEKLLDHGEAKGCDMTLSDSFLYAVGGNEAAGVGGGNYASAEQISITNMDMVLYGGKHGAGIGGGNSGSLSGICMENSRIEANAGSWGAGIGGGYEGNCSEVTIESSMITAYGGDSDDFPAAGGAGIGGGDSGSADAIYLRGSTIYACSMGYGAGIGAGGRKGELGYIEIDGGSVCSKGANSFGNGLYQMCIPCNDTNEELYLMKLELESFSEIIDIYDVNVLTNEGEEYLYDSSTMCTDESGRLYLYLPANASIISLETSKGYYYPNGGSILVEKKNTQNAVLTQNRNIISVGNVWEQDASTAQ